MTSYDEYLTNLMKQPIQNQLNSYIAMLESCKTLEPEALANELEHVSRLAHSIAQTIKRHL